jgi:DTW domain-containing protein YfiP
MLTEDVTEFRPVCMQCRRPKSVCYCEHLTRIDTQTKIVLLQHPRERDKAIGTARMASLCLPNAELHVGCDWENDKSIALALAHAQGNAALLYPGEDATDITALPRTAPLTLFVVDGTWWQTRKMVRSNPKLAALPRVAFKPARPSEYRIRKEPTEQCVSTIEALMYVLGALEGNPERFQALLTPFRAMIDAQIDCRERLHGARNRKRKTPRPARSPIPTCFRERKQDLVCVIGEANAWPYCCPERGSLYPDELVHWVAYRPMTGECFDYIVAPSHPLAPNTTRHIALTEEQLRAGGSATDLHTAFDAFLRPTDILCSWGCYATKLYLESGGTLPSERFDIRPLAHAVEKRKLGALEDYPLKNDAATLELDLTRGRAGLRLARLKAIVLDYTTR